MQTTPEFQAALNKAKPRDTITVKLTAHDAEPPEGSVVLHEGETGTAYQRSFTTGDWHSPFGKVYTWTALTAFKPGKRQYLLLVHRAPEDD